MAWAAANVKTSSSPRKRGEQQHGRSSETVEAALARLTRAYSAAMECVGSLHRPQTIDMKQRLFQAAKTTFEQLILLDPLILNNYAPTWKDEFQKIQIIDTSNKPAPPVLTSLAHQSTVRELAFLSLKNYADLLVHSATESWVEEESKEISYKLALVAYCDAVAVDGTDPTVWLKLAKTARDLDPVKYRRLERHALEQGRVALPPNVPPNRSILRALQEHAPPTVYAEFQRRQDTPTVVVDIPRYSWSVLGRLLLRACREGSAFQTHHHHHNHELYISKRDAFGSPQLELRLPPVLTLPPIALGGICQFLENDSIWRFEATCRALSASILSARASMERTRQHSTSREAAAVQLQQEEQPPAAEPALGESEDPGRTDAQQQQQQQQQQQEASHGNDGPANDPQNPSVARSQQAPRSDSQGEAAASQRASKRVRSKLITSGKLTERKWKQGSVRFCLLAAVMGCQPDDKRYMALLKVDVPWDVAMPDVFHVQVLSLDEQAVGRQRSTRREDALAEVRRRLGDSAISSFIQQCSGNAGPVDVLSHFLSHVAWNVEAVFSSDPGGTAILTTIILDCIEIVRKRNGNPLDIISHWLGTKPSPSNTDDPSLCFKSFAVNLLVGELRLRRSEQSHDESCGFDGDRNVLSLLVPELLEYMGAIESSSRVVDDRTWIALKARCHWLTCGFYMWWSRSSHHGAEARNAERVALEHLEDAVRCLQSPAGTPLGSIQTPHLESPSRSEPFWKAISEATLTEFREEQQASTVVTSARDHFVEVVSKITKRLAASGGDNSLANDERQELVEIGNSLTQRYNLPYESGRGRYDELFNEFIASNGDFDSVPSDEEGWGPLWSQIPSEFPMLSVLETISNASTLGILVTCLQAAEDKQLTILVVLSRILLSGYEQQGTLLSRLSSKDSSSPEAASEHDASDSDDSFSSDEEMSIEGNEGSDHGKADKIRLLLNCRVLQFLTEKAAEVLQKMTKQDLGEYARSKEFASLIHYSLVFCSDLSRLSTAIPTLNVSSDLGVFQSTQEFVSALLDPNLDMEIKKRVESLYFTGMARIMVSQAESLHPMLQPGNKRLGRKARQRLCVQRSRFFGAVACSASNLLSKSLALVESHHALRSSHLIDGLSSPDGLAHPGLPILLENALNLWNYVNAGQSGQGATGPNVSTFDKPILQELSVPVAALIVTLAGSAASTKRRLPLPLGQEAEELSDPLCLTEFYDSDASANEWVAAEEIDERAATRQELLRVVCQAVQSIHLVSEKISDKVVTSYEAPVQCDQDCGFLLPLVTARVLNNFADILLVECCRDFNAEAGRREMLWSESWPFGTRTIGELLDATLRKAYRLLHGINLDNGSSVASGGEDSSSAKFIPECVNSAVHLYRCITRTYANGKRSQPKAALECVISALPELEETERTRTLRNFLFDSKEDRFSTHDVVSLFTKNPHPTHFSSLPDWIWESNYSVETNASDETVDVLLVRKGICHQLAQGSLPTFSTGESARGQKNEDKKGEAEQRIDAARNEFDLGKKFNAIFDDLCYGELANSEGWYNAAQCLAMKAEVVADRIGLTNGFARAPNFHAPTDRSLIARMYPLEGLESLQEQEFARSQEGWVPFLGNDLSVFIQYSWASFSSLEECSQEVGRGYRDSLRGMDQSDDLDDRAAHQAFRFQLWQEIEVLYRKENFALWQQAWGGIFVSALRKLATRCRCLAFFLSSRQSTDESAAVSSEISEAQALAYYSEIMGSQVYGYPMRAMTQQEKRQLASAARKCFQLSLDDTKNDDESDARVTWDLQFIIGKSYEKVASTYKQEAYQNTTDDEPPDGQGLYTRSYELHMKKALACYSRSLEEALAIQKEGGLSDVSAGGSCHGSTELLYRLHATRLKCLIWAVSRDDSTRDAAEREALRLTTAYWYREENKVQLSADSSTRDIVWAVLADIIAALAQCRIEQPFFHRSVYRHAQALMWASLLHDPSESEGSLGVVPASKSHHLRGLNSSTPCVNSAEVVMRVLFEKKRSQLCAVWVTNSSITQGPFEVLNNAVRKYDSLRGKYVSAYIDTLRLGRRTAQLEAILQWTVTAKRDLPAFFYASAEKKGEPPERPHIRESLLLRGRSLASTCFLRTVKRECNAALADVLLQQLLTNSVDSKVDPFKTAYACYLRMNCTAEEIERNRAWKYGRGSIPEIDALVKAFLARRDHDHETVSAVGSDWTGGSQKITVLKAAIARGKELYPALNNQSKLYGKKKAAPKKQSKKQPKAGAAAAASGEEEDKKRKEPETTTKSFIVDVPEGLHAGDKFTKTLQISEGVTKTVKITVPPGSPPKIRFTLTVPSSEGGSPEAKRPKEGDA